MISELGKWLTLAGVVIMAIGLAFTFFPAARLGRLPGDVTISFKNGRIFIPFTTCVVLSVLLSLVIRLIAYLRR